MQTPPHILLIGEAPLPYGGIATHCVRLLAWLRAQGWHARLMHLPSFWLTQPAVPDPDLFVCRNGLPQLLHALWREQPDLVHQHVYRWRVPLALAAYNRLRQQRNLPRVRAVATIHGESFFATIPPLVRPAVYAALRSYDHILADNPLLLQRVRNEVGVPAQRVSQLGAFLPPGPSERDPSQLPADVLAFAKAHQPLVAGNGAVASFRGEDKYGIDLVLQAIDELRKRWPDIGLVFSITDVQDAARMTGLEQLIAQRNLAPNVRFVRELPSLLPVLGMATASVRATNTDGDALSVHESLMMGTPVVASDVVVRPPLCERFANRDAADLARVLAATIEKGRVDPAQAAQVAHIGADLLAVYRRVLA